MNRTYTQRKQSFTDRLHQWFYWNSNTVPVNEISCNKYFLFLPNYSFSQIILKRLTFMRSQVYLNGEKPINEICLAAKILTYYIDK